MDTDDEHLNFENDEELRELVERALKDNIKERKTFKRSRDLAYRLSTVISEYLDSYILLGYDFSGKHLDIKAAKTPQQLEALNSFLLKYFAAEVNSIKGINPPSPDDLL
jgi:hypothetical protein|tara:strand:+ start:438 stop:764 length:327 start_codon:yes stop_codon:yes gene_type:complete